VDHAADNLEAVEAGRIPPPDTEVIVRWDEADVAHWKARQSRMARATTSTGEVEFRWEKRDGWEGRAVWIPSVGDVLYHFRRWQFPNGRGLAVSYSGLNPLPGRAPIAHLIAAEDHECDSDPYEAAGSQTVEEAYAALAERLEVKGQTQLVKERWLHGQSFRFKRGDDASLLRALRNASGVEPYPEEDDDE
jgi:hypothetical protein